MERYDQYVKSRPSCYIDTKTRGSEIAGEAAAALAATAIVFKANKVPRCASPSSDFRLVPIPVAPHQEVATSIWSTYMLCLCCHRMHWPQCSVAACTSQASRSQPYGDACFFTSLALVPFPFERMQRLQLTKGPWAGRRCAGTLQGSWCTPSNCTTWRKNSKAPTRAPTPGPASASTRHAPATTVPLLATPNPPPQVLERQASLWTGLTYASVDYCSHDTIFTVKAEFFDALLRLFSSFRIETCRSLVRMFSDGLESRWLPSTADFCVAQRLYGSQNGFFDELAWAAAWIFKARFARPAAPPRVPRQACQRTASVPLRCLPELVTTTQFESPGPTMLGCRRLANRDTSQTRASTTPK